MERCLRVVCAAVVLLVLASRAEAQTHPCDATPGSSATVTEGTIQIGWCHNVKDANGNTTTITGWAFYANAVRTGLTNVTTNGVANAAGLVFYQASVNIARGNWTVTIAALNAQGEGGKSSPFQLEAVAPATVPSVPTRLRVL